MVDRTNLSFRRTKTKVLSLLTFNAILFYNDFHSHRFQGCIGHVTQTAPGESPRPLALRSSEWTGSDCESYCAPGWKCNPIDDVTGKECECPGYGNEEPICKLDSSRSKDNLANIITASSLALSESTNSFPPVVLFSNSVEVRHNSSVDNNGSAMAKTGSALRILGSFVLVCLVPTVSLLSGLMTR